MQTMYNLNKKNGLVTESVLHLHDIRHGAPAQLSSLVIVNLLIRVSLSF